MDWCIVLVEMPLTRFEECWPLPTESLPELPENLNVVTLTLTLWPINSGVLTLLILPHLSSSLTDCLPSLNLLCHSKTHARFMQYGQKVVWSIPCVSVAFFLSLKHNFIAHRSSKVSDCIFEIHQLWQSGFSRMYSNCYCSCSFEPETIKIGQSTHKMYSNNIVNFQESWTILNSHTKSLETYRIPLVYIFFFFIACDDNHYTNGTSYIYIYIYIHEFKSWTRLIAFHIALIPLGKVWIQLLSLHLWVNSRTD